MTTPTRDQADLAQMLETLLDKGVVINADIAVTVGETELLSVHIRAAIASFETAAAYGLAFPSGTDTDRLADAAGLDAENLDSRSVSVTEAGEREAEPEPEDTE